MEIKRYNNFDKLNEGITDKDEAKVRKVVRDWFYQKLVYSTQWMIYSENDIQDQLLPEVEDMGYTFDVQSIEYDEKLLEEVVDQITDSIMNSVR